MFLIVVAHTPLLAVANRRAYYRVPVEDRVAVIPQSPENEPAGKAVWCLFQNLSVGGCALYSDCEFHEEQRLFVLLPTPQLKLRVRSEVLSARRSPSGPLPYSYRIGFIHKSSKQMVAVGDLVMHIQRKLLIEQGEIDEDESETARTKSILKNSMNMGSAKLD